MTVGTSSAEPDRLAGFAPAEAASAESLTTALGSLSTDLAALDATVSYYAPSGFAPDECLTAVGEVQAWSSHLACWVTAVGEAFRAAGRDPEGDGVVRVRDRAVGLVGRAALDDQREWLADQLATIDERLREGEEVDPHGLAQVVAQARELIDAAPDPQAEARRLIERMGPADIEAALRVFGPGAARATRLTDPAIVALCGLGYVVSLGLEDDPARAARWAGALTGPGSPIGRLSGRETEGLALFGAGNAPGTSTFGALLAVGLLARGAATSPFGVSWHLYGSEDPLAPLVAAATARDATGFTQARLANRIVDRLASTGRGEPLAEVFGGDTQVAADRSRLLLAAVDPALPEPDRVEVAIELAAHYHDLGQRLSPWARISETYGRDATASFAAATQPLFEHVTSDGTEGQGTIAIGSRSFGHDGVLWRAVDDFAGAPGGADGISAALAGATTARLARGFVGAPSVATTGTPFQEATLTGLDYVYGKVASSVGQRRFSDLLAHVDDDGARRSDAVLAAAYGVAGEVPGGSTATGVTEALAILSTREARALAPGSAGSPLAGVQARLTRDLVAFNLAAHPEWATDDLREALRTAVSREGTTGITLLLVDQENQFGEGHGPQLEALRGAVTDQLAATGIRQSTSVATTTSPGGG